MYFMEKTKTILNICIGISLVLCSVSLLIFSTRENKAIAQTGGTLPSGIMLAGPVLVGSGFTANYYLLGYDPKDGQVSVLGKIGPKEILAFGK
jgi:hypothetical protein